MDSRALSGRKVDLGLTDKRILITGGSRGIGLAIARRFLGEGARVAILARNEAHLSLVADELRESAGEERVLAFSLDCADPNAWPPAVQKLHDVWHGVDIVVANVGDGRGPQDPIPGAARFSEAWRENFSSAEVTARVCLPLLEATGGSLLFVSSIAGLEVIGAPTDYSVAKTAVIALAKQLAHRLAPKIRVNCIAPGNVLFSGGSWAAKIEADPTRIRELIESSVPMNRFGTSEEIADAVLFLSSYRSAFTTGACLVVDGGQTSKIL